MNDAVVFVVDDDEAVRDGVSSLLRSVGLSVQTFASPREFLAAHRPEAPSCLILDVRLPEASGLEFQRELNHSHSKLPIIFITAHGDVPMSVRAMKAGALEFLIKPFRDQELIDAVQQAINQDRSRRREEGSVGELTQRWATLTLREREVMTCLVTGQLNKQIGAALGTTESTIKAHRTQVMRKMGARSIPELVRMADRLQAAPPLAHAGSARLS